MQKSVEKISVLVISACLALTNFAFAAAPTKPAITGNEKEVVEEFIALVSRPGADKSPHFAFDDIAQKMDFEEMARRAFGESGWPKFSLNEQKEVTLLFRRLIQIRFYPRWRRVFQNGHFEVLSQSKQNNDSLVSGKLKLEGKPTNLTFRLVKTAGGFKLISMSVNNKDLLERTSVRLKRGLVHKGAAGLIVHLRKRTAEATRDTTEKAPLDELISGGK